MKLLRQCGKNLIVLAFWLAVWELLALRVGSALLLPEPRAVAERTVQLVLTPQFWHITGVSLLRILCGVAAGVVLGTMTAALTARFKALRALLSPALTMVKSTPVASFIILALIWMGRDTVPCFIAFLMVLPMVWTNVSTGIAQVDTQLLETARVFRFTRRKACRLVYIPSCAPYFISACRAALGLGWKAGIAAEILTVPQSSIGKMLYESKLYLETTDLFAWTLVVILCSLVIEKVLMAAVGRLGGRHANGGAR